MDLYSEMFYGKPYSKLPYFTKYRYIVDAFAFAEQSFAGLPQNGHGSKSIFCILCTS